MNYAQAVRNPRTNSIQTQSIENQENMSPNPIIDAPDHRRRILENININTNPSPIIINPPRNPTPIPYTDTDGQWTVEQVLTEIFGNNIPTHGIIIDLRNRQVVTQTNTAPAFRKKIDQITTPTTPRDSEEECSICIEGYTPNNNPVKTKCNHYYHRSCLKTWIKEHNTCPLCRTRIF